MPLHDKKILLVGNFLAGSMISRHVCEDLAQQLAGSGWQVITVSNKFNRFARFIDMVGTPY
ncbi:MAG: hypothetical protein ACHP6H_07110, partial [Legionellales bacterium]